MVIVCIGVFIHLAIRKAGVIILIRILYSERVLELNVSNLYKGSYNLRGSIFSFEIHFLKIFVDFINITPFQPGYKYNVHMHSNYELHYITKGKGRVAINEKEFKLNKGDFYITGPNVKHWQKADELKPMVEYCMRFDIALKENHELDDENMLNEYRKLIDILENETKFVIGDLYDIEALFNKLFLEAVEKKIGYYQSIMNYISSIIFYSARNFHDEQSKYALPKVTLNQHRINIIKKYIYDNIANNISSEEISNYMFISKRHLGRIIKDTTGMTLHNLVLDIKLKKVVYYLKNTNMTLRGIAEVMGFSNEFHLSRIVKKHTGKNPSQIKGNRSSLNIINPLSRKVE